MIHETEHNALEQLIIKLVILYIEFFFLNKVLVQDIEPVKYTNESRCQLMSYFDIFLFKLLKRDFIYGFQQIKYFKRILKNHLLCENNGVVIFQS